MRFTGDKQAASAVSDLMCRAAARHNIRVPTGHAEEQERAKSVNVHTRYPTGFARGAGVDAQPVPRKGWRCLRLLATANGCVREGVESLDFGVCILK